MSFHFKGFTAQKDSIQRSFNPLSSKEFTYSRNIILQGEIDFIDLGSPAIEVISHFISQSRVYLEDYIQLAKTKILLHTKK